MPAEAAPDAVSIAAAKAAQAAEQAKIIAKGQAAAREAEAATKLVCCEFLEGRCGRGESCKHSHADDGISRCSCWEGCRRHAPRNAKLIERLAAAAGKPKAATPQDVLREQFQNNPTIPKEWRCESCASRIHILLPKCRMCQTTRPAELDRLAAVLAPPPQMSPIQPLGGTLGGRTPARPGGQSWTGPSAMDMWKAKQQISQQSAGAIAMQKMALLGPGTPAPSSATAGGQAAADLRPKLPSPSGDAAGGGQKGKGAGSRSRSRRRSRSSSTSSSSRSRGKRKGRDRSRDRRRRRRRESRHRDRRNRDRDRDRGRHRDGSRDRNRDRSKDRKGSRDRDRDRDRSRERRKDWRRGRSRDESRGKHRVRDSDGSTGRDRGRDRDKRRAKNRALSLSDESDSRETSEGKKGKGGKKGKKEKKAKGKKGKKSKKEKKRRKDGSEDSLSKVDEHSRG